MATLPTSAARILRDMQSRQRRRKSPFFLVEGDRACAEACQLRPDWIEFAVFAESANFAVSELVTAPAYRLSDQEFDNVSATDTPQGILLVCRRPELSDTTIDDPFLLILDQVRDPGNVGTILRTAWAIGLRTVLWTTGTADPWGPKTIRAGMGAQFAVTPIKTKDTDAALDLAKKHGYNRCWQPTPHGGVSCYDPDFDLNQSVLLIGNETVDTKDLTGDRVCIPMPGRAESLNVAQATTILLFESVRRNQ